jgi:hypothetical protein
MEDPLAKYPSPLAGEGGRRPGEGSNIEDATASWPKPKGDRKANSKAGKPGTRAYRGPKR